MLVVALLLPLSSCEDLTDLNVDPNNPTDVPASNLVTQAEFMLSNRLWSRNLNAEWGMLMVQQWAQNEYTEEGRFDVDGTNFNLSWIELYAEVLRELQVASEMIAADEGLAADIQANQLAIIEIMAVHCWQNITDAWGDVPYSQALNSADNPLPAYDNQSTIYPALLNRLRTAVGTISTGASSFSSGDVIYNGDMTSWKKLGNSLMMRMAMRMSNIDEAAAKDFISGLSASDMITDNSENGMFAFDANPSIANPLYVDNVINVRDDFSVSTTLVDMMVGDPRLDAYAKPNNSGDIVGMPPTVSDATAFGLNTTTSRPNDNVRAATAPGVIIDAAEVHFMLAEAYQRGILTGDAAAEYAAGITASMNYWGITDATAIADYITANPYDAGNYQQSIGTQKWLAFYMNGGQAWAEWRRLGHPELSVSSDAMLADIPVRLPYPISEQQSNSGALGLVDGGDPNDLSTRMWWDVD